jgi:hypothetical protein
MQLFPHFARMFDRSNTLDSVCLRCLGIVCQGCRVDELEIAEASHVCHETNVARLGRLRDRVLTAQGPEPFVGSSPAPWLM